MVSRVLNIKSDAIVSYSIKRDIGDDWWSASVSMKAQSHDTVPHQRDIITVTDGVNNIFLGIVDENDYVYSTPSKTYKFNIYSFEYILDKQFLRSKDNADAAWKDQLSTAILVKQQSGATADLIGAYENPYYFIMRLLFDHTSAKSEITVAATTGVVSDITYNKDTPLAGIYEGVIDTIPYWNANCKPWEGDETTTGGVYDVKWKQFKFSSTSTKLKAIAEICDYCNMIFYTRIEDRGSGLRHYGYLVHEKDITKLDTLGGSPIIIDNSLNMIVPDVTRNDGGGSLYTTVEAVGYDKNSGKQFSAIGVIDATAPYAIPFRYEMSDSLELIETSDSDKAGKTSRNTTRVKAKAAELVNFFNGDDILFTVPLKYNGAIKPWNTVKVLSHPEIPNDVMRVTYVEHTFNETQDLTVIKCQVDTRWCLMRELNRLMGSSYKNSQKEMKEDFWVDLTEIEVARLIGISANNRYGIAQLNSGGKAQIILLNYNAGV